MSIKNAIAEARKSVVSIDATKVRGSGFVIAQRRVVTNAHVVESATTVQLGDERKNLVAGTVMWRDKAKDLALVVYDGQNWPPLKIGNLSGVEVGDEVFAIGHPLGLDYTVTRGIVSSIAREFKGHSYIQTDVAISPGNSGGPLLDVNGNVIGINSFLLRDGNSLNFAIPIDRAIEAIERGIQPVVSTQGGDASCPTCENPVSSAEIYCPTCGSCIHSRRGQQVVPSSSSLELASQRSRGKAQCPCCNTNILEDAPYCNVCGTKIRRR